MMFNLQNEYPAVQEGFWVTTGGLFNVLLEQNLYVDVLQQEVARNWGPQMKY